MQREPEALRFDQPGSAADENGRFVRARVEFLRIYRPTDEEQVALRLRRAECDRVRLITDGSRLGIGVGTHRAAGHLED